MFLEPLDVEEVLLAPSSTLVDEEMLVGQHGGSLVRESGWDSAGPSLLEDHAVNGSDHVDSNRLNTHLEDEARSRKVFNGQVMEWGAKVGQRGENAFGVGRMRANPDIEVFRCANEAMRG
jgi:hypothetical protein